MAGATTAAGEDQMKHALTYDKTSYKNPREPSKTRQTHENIESHEKNGDLVTLAICTTNNKILRTELYGTNMLRIFLYVLSKGKLNDTVDLTSAIFFNKT